MIDFGKWALGNRKLVYFLIAVMVVGGVLAFIDMSKLEDPEIKVKQAMVVVLYPGASSNEVELQAAIPLEEAIRSMKSVKEVESRSMNDMAIITVSLRLDTDDSDVEQQWDVLRRKVNDIYTTMPNGVRPPTVIDTFGDVYGMFYAMTSDGFSQQELKRYAELMKREVQAIDGISDVSIYGEPKEAVDIELSWEKMANLGVLPIEVISTVSGQNETVYSGYYNAGDSRIRVTVNDKYRSVDDIGNLLLQGHEDDQIRLKEIADIRMVEEEPIRNQLFYDGTKALGLSISVKSGEDVTKLGKLVEQRLEELQSTVIPAGIEFHKVFFQPDKVNSAINTFIVNLIMSVAIVILLLIFTMGRRSGTIIGMVLLFTVLGSIAVLYLFDGTLQRVSLGAFILAMGMLVDNAIVIADGILVDLQRGVPRAEALTAIGRKTAMPLLGATLIAILAFLPIALSPDTAGVYVRDLFIVLAVSLIISWLLAVTYVPIAAESQLKVAVNASSDPYDSKYYRVLQRTLRWILCHKSFTIASALVLVAASIYCYRFLPQEFFPDMEYNQLYIEYKLPEGENYTAVQRDLKQIEDWLGGRDEVTHITTSLGGTPSRYNLVRSIAIPSLSYGELIVDFSSYKLLVKNMEEIQTYLEEHYPQAFVRTKRYNLMYKKHSIEVRFSGPDPAVLKSLTAQAEDIMRRNPTTRLVCNDWEPEVPNLVIDYDQPIARALGFTRTDVGISALAATDGIPVGTFYDGRNSQQIIVKCLDRDGRPIEMLNNTPVFSTIPPVQNIDMQTISGLMTGALSQEELLEGIMRTVPLSQTTSGISMQWSDPVVVRVNSQRAMRAQCDPASGVTVTTARNDILDQIEAIELPDGYSMKWEGEYQASKDATVSLFSTFPIAIVFMIAILIMLFKDYRKPLIIICCMPLICVGVVFGMLLSGKAFGFVAIVGTLGLIGMLIKNGIVLMDEIQLQLSSGAEPVKALLDSSSSRFRPVMMASLTTILGMIPLLPDCLFGALAVTIMAGLLVGTLITLLFIPILYALFFNIKITKK